MVVDGVYGYVVVDGFGVDVDLVWEEFLVVGIGFDGFYFFYCFY